MEQQLRTARDWEMIVLASMIHPDTARAASKIVREYKLKPAEMFTDPDLKDQYDFFKRHGAAEFGGYLFGIPLADLATPFVEVHVARIVREYKRHLAETDRTLDSFETPGPDTDDPDCLFQNRWLRRGACGAIVSTSGVGKSSFTMQAAVQWAAGQECLGVRPLRPLRIGIFQSEDDEFDVANFRDRIRIGLDKELGWTRDQVREAEARVTFCALDGSTGQHFVEHIRRKQLAYHFDLIIINPLFAFFGGDMNDGDSMTTFLRHGIDPLIKNEDTKCGCLIVHHTGKPNREAMSQGDIFKAYLGSGSGEFTNYIRSALVITPYNLGKNGDGIFELIGAKHGDKLGWRTEDGKPTKKKVVCYANRLPEYQGTGIIFWTEPDPFQLSELKRPGGPEGVGPKPKKNPIDMAADKLAEIFRAERMDGAVGEFVRRRCGKSRTGFSQRTNMLALDLIKNDPARWGLAKVTNGRAYWFVPADEDGRPAVPVQVEQSAQAPAVQPVQPDRIDPAF